MAHIVEFTVTGLAGRSDTYSRQLNRDVNIFYGRNGSGKTSLIKILHSAMNNDASILRTVPFKRAEVKIFTIQLDRVITRTFEQARTPPQSTEDVQAVFGQPPLYTAWPYELGQVYLQGPTWQTIEKLPETFRAPLGHVYLPTSRIYSFQARGRHGRTSEGLDTSTEEELDKYFATWLTELWTNYTSELLVAVRKAQENGLASILKAVLTPGTPVQNVTELDPKLAYRRVLSFLQRQGSPSSLRSLDEFISRYDSDARLQSVVRDIDRVEQQIEEATAPRNKLQTLIQTMFGPTKLVKFEDRAIKVETESQEEIGLATLSSGEKHILLLFVEALSAGPNSVMIDEPEISMHIDWQRSLIPSMQLLNPSAQLIMASHSPEVIADVDDSKIFRL